MISDFGGANTTKGNTGPFWVGSALAIVSAVTTFFLVRPLSHDGMVEEDEKFRLYLEEHGFDTSLMGLASESQSTFETEKRSASIEADVKEPVEVA